jgi:Pyruvate/2-oxoacid:ferredoxin oxidoreductase gamma subunit
MKKMSNLEEVKKQFERYMGLQNRQDCATVKPMTDAVSRYELDAKLAAIETRMDAKIDRIVESNVRIEAGISSMKNTTIITAVSAVLAIVFGIAAFNAALLSNMTASFESGKTTASAIVQASENLKQTQDELKAIRERLDQQAKPSK